MDYRFFFAMSLRQTRLLLLYVAVLMYLVCEISIKIVEGWGWWVGECCTADILAIRPSYRDINYIMFASCWTSSYIDLLHATVTILV